MLGEKGIDYETVVVDLDDRPCWIMELNPPDGRVPVLEQADPPLLPESLVIMRYLDERFAEPALMPTGLEERALVELAFERFDALISRPYYRLKRGRCSSEELQAALARFGAQLGEGGFVVGSSYSLADIAYVPWILRAELVLGMSVREDENIASWLERLEEREPIRTERAVVGSLVA